MLNYDTLPNDHAAGGMRRYFERGIMPGSFLSAVLTNDLRGACEHADDVNQRLLVDYVRWLYNYAPDGSWGSEANVKAYIEMVRRP